MVLSSAQGDPSSRDPQDHFSHNKPNYILCNFIIFFQKCAFIMNSCMFLREIMTKHVLCNGLLHELKWNTQ